jgi:uncharacterized protein YbjT (DUF2867 family)
LTPKILVTSAPGNVGGEVVKGLQGKAPFRIGAYRVEAAQKIFNDQDYARFDFLDPATYEPTFTGIETMFLVRPPALSNVKRDIAPALIAAKQAGVEHIVFLSLQGVEKNRVVPHHKIEKLILELGFAYTFLRAGFFMQNLSTTHAAEIRDQNVIAVPVGKARTSFIDVRDIAGVAVRALLEEGHRNKIYTLTGSEALDYDEVSQAMSSVLARPIRYTNPSLVTFLRHQLAAGRPFAFALVMAALYTITRFGAAKQVTPDAQRILGREPIAFRQFVQDYQTCWQ